MGYENDQYRDEDGEPLMDYDDVQSDEEQTRDDLNDIDNFNEGFQDDYGGNWRQERSPTPVYNDSEHPDHKSKTRKRLIKKSDKHSSIPPELNDFADEDAAANDYGVGSSSPSAFVRDDWDEPSSSSALKRKSKITKEGGEMRKKEKKLRRDKPGGSSSGKDRPKLSLRRRKGEDGDPEMKEMWDTIAGGDSEDDKEGMRTVDDDNFIDDTGVDPADRYEDDREVGSPSRYAQAVEGEEDDDEIKNLFSLGKKKKKNEKNPAEINDMVENLIAEFEVTAEEDAKLNEQGKPAINKLKKLPLLVNALSKKQLQHEFLDRGILITLRFWLEPLPDGSLPNINIREAILRILTDLPIDLDQFHRKEQLKLSGLGKSIMFLSRSEEETTANRKLAKELVDKWSRPIFNKSTRFEDMRNADDERMPYQRPSVKRPMNRASGLESKDDDLDLPEFPSEKKSANSKSRPLTTRPEAMPMDFLIRPQSKVDPNEIRARAKQVVQDPRRLKMNKKLQHLKATKKKQLQATKVSVEGRGMVKYL